MRWLKSFGVAVALQLVVAAGVGVTVLISRVHPLAAMGFWFLVASTLAIRFLGNDDAQDNRT